MLSFLIFCVLAFIVWLLVWSIVSLVKIGALEREIIRLNTRFSDQAAILNKLRAEFRVPRMDAPASPPLAGAVEPAAHQPQPLVHRGAPIEPPATPVIPAPVVPAPPVETVAVTGDLTLPPFVPPDEPPPPAAAPPPPAGSPSINWEQFMA